MLYLGTLYNHFLLVCRFPITDTKGPIWSFPPGLQEKVRATGSTWRGIPLLLRTHARSSAGTAAGSHSLRGMNQRPPGSAKTRPAPSGVGRTLTLQKANTHHRHPGQAALSLDSAHLSPAGASRRPLASRATETWTPWTLPVPSGCCFCLGW